MSSLAIPMPVSATTSRKHPSGSIPARTVISPPSGGSGRTLAFGPGHVDGSPLPGEAGNSIIGGHRDTYFRVLERLRPGDIIRLQDRKGVTHGFRVTAAEVVDSRRARLDLTDERPRLILVTCYPFDAVAPGGPLRYLVFAEKADGALPRLAAAPP